MRSEPNKRARNQAAIMAAVALAAGAASPAMAVYSGTTTFQQTDPVGGPYPLDNALNWSAGLPSATTLAIMANATANPAASTIPLTAYGISYANTGGINLTISGQPITVVSTDSVVDTTAMTSPAFHYASTGTGEFQINNNIILGDGSVTSGTAYVKNDGAARLLLGGNVTQAPGTSWGLTFLPASTDYRLRSANNAGNYLTNRFVFSGPLTITAGADVRVFTNLLPYGAGLPNTVIDGRLRHSANANAILINAIDGAATGTIDRSTGDEFVVGANGANGNFAGNFLNASTRLNKVGAGVQTLSGSNANGGLAIVGPGTVSGNSIADAGVNSAFGRGPTSAGSFTYNSVVYTFAGTIIDGGTMQYTGPTASTNRVIDVGFRGGTLDASGTGAVTFAGTINSTDLARVWGDQLESGTSSVVPNMYGLEGLGALASQLTIANVNGFTSAAFTTSIFNAVGTTPVSIDETNRTMELAAIGTDGTNPALVGFPGNNQGAPRVDLLSKTGFDRTLALTGTNTDPNTISAVLANSSLGGKLNVTKNGTGQWVLSGANSYTGTTTVNAGTLSVTAAGIPLANAVVVNGGSYSMSDATGAVFRPGTLTVNAGQAEVATNGGNTLAIVHPNLTLGATGKLQMNDNDLIVDYTGASPEGAIRQLVKDGRANAASGIFATPGNPDDDVVLAVADNAAWGKTIFNNVNIDSDTVVGKYTYFGDANLDGKVTGDDYLNVDANLGTGDSWLEGDFNMSGVTTGDDYLAIDANLGKGTANPLAFAELKEEMVALHAAMFGEEYLVKLAQAEAEGFGASVVPEPAAISLIGLGAVGLLSRRRRK